MRLAHFRGTGVCSYAGVACIANMASPGLLLEVNDAVMLPGTGKLQIQDTSVSYLFVLPCLL